TISPRELYQWLDDVEDLEQYSPGGYHPVHIDDVLNGRYCIVHKLGFGSYSTVWLARDQQQNRFVAMKFTIASASAESPETRILHHINASGHQHPGRKFIATLLDDFELEGPNGRHRCLVMEVVGPSVGKVRYETPGNTLPMSIARKVALQSAQGLAFLHSSGVVHGDFHPNNILLEIPDFHSWPVEKIYEHLGKPRKQTVKRTDGNPVTPSAPTYVVKPLHPLLLARRLLDSDYCSIKITDFGESFLATDTDKRFLNTPIAFAAPETIFRDSISPKVDIWALACLIYEVLGNHALLESFFKDPDEIITEMVRTFGKLPDRWWKQWEERDTFFEEDGTFKTDSGYMSGKPRTMDLKERLGDIRRDDEKGQEELRGDLEALELVLEKMLRYEPEQRISVEEVVSLLPF
ncbi:Serine/threonine-protein kinase SRPK1, partial [Termitomyces sp. J132]